MSADALQRERTTDLGRIRIHNDVLASIASNAASEIKGVYKLGGGFTRNVCNFFTNKCTVKGVRVTSTESDVRLSVSVIVEYGVNIPRVADEVQDNIKRQVQKMTGLVLNEVNVDVEGVHAAGAPRGEPGVR